MNVMHWLILGMLGLLFVTLKLLGVIGWTWWLVLLPFWIQPILVVACLALAIFVARWFDE